MGQLANFVNINYRLLFFKYTFSKDCIKSQKNNLGATGFIGKNQFPSRNRLGMPPKEIYFLNGGAIKREDGGGGVKRCK